MPHPEEKTKLNTKGNRNHANKKVSNSRKEIYTQNGTNEKGKRRESEATRYEKVEPKPLQPVKWQVKKPSNYQNPA